jgi:hypothetical protein
MLAACRQLIDLCHPGRIPPRLPANAAPEGIERRANWLRDTARDFWSWFAAHAERLERLDCDPLIQAQLDQRVAGLGGFGWEVGPAPGDSGGRAFVLSPCGSPELLEQSSAIVALAPALEGWQFLAAKPPKNRESCFEVIDDDDLAHLIDASEWRYALSRYPDGQFEIVIQAPDITGLPEEAWTAAVAMVLDAELGERERMQWIAVYDVVDELEPDLRLESNPIDVLGDHLRKLQSHDSRPT